ncbi:hemerythrin domain-containing protein [Pseudonocardia bannensis]|uniref:Hemerythrin domain-containing protein n=1 Tax=Pseudonocardia bannensis TaxID=630973 RepID=A0A848DR52_9PSEU|nr:hemerythrin domain-containing protein [Pseudonocardia bannensis]NMH95317.1 hemerythrin domain-containing protein [Pseudonocardia bannensis]
MPDITQLILDDHEWFRREFAALDDLRAQTPMDADALRSVWEPLAARLDVHAIAEEEIFYPQLLRHGDDAEDETLDAIGDHNDIRDGVHDAARHPIGSRPWWEAVGRARVANDEHMGEEENEGLADFRLNAPSGLRESLGKRFAEFMTRHETTRALDTGDKDPERYVRDIEREIDPPDDRTVDGSLGIGSLKGR